MSEMLEDKGYIVVRVGCLPGKIEEIALNGGRTVENALEAVDLEPEGYEIRVNGRPAEPASELVEDDTVLLVKKIKGNN